MAKSNTLPEQPQTFELFPRFPPEIREEVWKLCFPLSASQITLHSIVTDSRLSRRQSHSNTWDHRKIVSTAQRKIPSLLHCCRESRALALKHYTVGLKLEHCLAPRPNFHIHLEKYSFDKADEVVTLNRKLYWDPENDFFEIVNICEMLTGCVIDGFPPS